MAAQFYENYRQSPTYQQLELSIMKRAGWIDHLPAGFADYSGGSRPSWPKKKALMSDTAA